jgi:hypothetical protein
MIKNKHAINTNGTHNKDQGETNADTMTDAPIHVNHSIKYMILKGREVSILLISLENRFNSFPVGVLSKYKLIGARSTHSVISLCRIPDTRKVDIIIKKNPIVTRKPNPHE